MKFIFNLWFCFTLITLLLSSCVLSEIAPDEQVFSVEADRKLIAAGYKVVYNEEGQRFILDARGKIVRSLCAVLRLDAGEKFYQRSKEFLASYYKTRKQSDLFYAWYSSQDSFSMISTVRKCKDKLNKHFYAVKNLQNQNAIIQDLIMVNARTKEHSQFAQLYLDDYKKLFPLDIQ